MPDLATSISKELLPQLNEHLGSLSVLLHQYLKHTWLTRDLPDVSKATKQSYQAVITDMNRLGKTIVRLKGVPVGGMLEHVNLSYLEPEDEGKHPVINMLEHDVYLENVHRSQLSFTLETANDLCERKSVKVLGSLLLEAQKRAELLATLGQQYRRQ